MTTDPSNPHPDDANAAASDPDGASSQPLPPPPPAGDEPAASLSPPLTPPQAESAAGASPTDVPVTSDGGDGGGTSRGRLVGGLLVVVALIAAGAFAITRIAGGEDEAAGAGSPEELGQQALEAFDNADVLGAVRLMLPGERATLGEPMVELVREFERLEILSDVNLSSVQGVDVTVAEPEVEVVETGADDIVYVEISGEAASQVNPEELPSGDLIDRVVQGESGGGSAAVPPVSTVVIENEGDDDEVTGDDEASEDEASEDEGSEDEVAPEPAAEPFQLRLVGVEEDGQWYLSVWYWLAEMMRSRTVDDQTGEPLPIPEEGITPRGGETPEGAITVVTEALSDGDLEGIIGAINPDEAQALQRYAPLFIDDAAEAFEQSEIEIEFTDVEVRAEGSGDERQLYFEKVAADISADVDESELPVGGDMPSIPDEAHVVLEDGCLTFEGGGESVNTCELEAAGAGSSGDFRDMLDEQFGDSEEMAELVDAFAAAFEDFEAPGITVSQVDGQWYVSPMSTGWTGLLAVTGALDAEELDHLVDLGEDMAQSIGEDLTED